MEPDEVKWLMKSMDLTKMVSFTAHHDLKGTAAGIRFAAETLNEMISAELQESLEIKDVIAMLLMDVRRQDLILEGIGDWLRFLKGEEQNWTPVHLGDLLSELTETERYEGLVKIGELPTLQVSRGQFASLFDNLIRNGLHYNDSTQPTVSIFAEAGSIVVADNGNGFEMAHFETMCKPFHRLDNSRKGTGLGMTIIRAVCYNHRFELTAGSQLGVGSQFFIKYIK